MSPQTQAWLQLGAQAAEAMVWLVLSLWALQRLRTQVWARFAALGAVLLFVPATTLTAARAQVLIGDDATIVANYTQSLLPTTYAVMRVLAALLLLTALVVAPRVRRPGPAPAAT